MFYICKLLGIYSKHICICVYVCVSVSRWWEARILWGNQLNTSRNLARQVCCSALHFILLLLSVLLPLQSLHVSEVCDTWHSVLSSHHPHLLLSGISNESPCLIGQGGCGLRMHSFKSNGA